ncbi:acyl-CoA dehydrogenase family protein [Micromonospora sp. NPDC048830]|uniref:acyl-CoA dehydrogenase family protein n=1 Tax=Micromonospora sp. NPDC048830 TaxID=3364257 RepID=UPI0037215257
MDFAPGPDQRLLADSIHALGVALNAQDEHDRSGGPYFSRQKWRRCGEFGLLGLSLPERWGGLGLDSLSTALAIEAFARGHEDMGLVFSACAHLFACAMPIAVHGTDSVRDEVLPKLGSGEWIAANAITEAEAGSDVYAMRATAVRDGDRYVLDGVKNYVTNAPLADVFVVYASTDPRSGYLGISAFVVHRDTPGVTVGSPLPKTGLASSPLAPVYLDGVAVPVANRLGGEGDGRDVFTGSMEWERTCLFAAYVGAMDRQLGRTVAYTSERRQFRKSLARHQAVAHRLADMKLRLESARLLLYHACWARDQGTARPLDVSLAKLGVSEAATRNALDAVHLHGGAGIMAGSGVEQAIADAVPASLFSGTSEIHRDVIAAELRRET